MKLSSDTINKLNLTEQYNIKNRIDANWSLYIHTIPKQISGYDNDKKYVGITSRHPTQRWGSRGNGYMGQPFSNAIKKYGWENIEDTASAFS